MRASALRARFQFVLGFFQRHHRGEELIVEFAFLALQRGDVVLQIEQFFGVLDQAAVHALLGLCDPGFERGVGQFQVFARAPFVRDGFLGSAQGRSSGDEFFGFVQRRFDFGQAAREPIDHGVDVLQVEEGFGFCHAAIIALNGIVWQLVLESAHDRSSPDFCRRTTVVDRRFADRVGPGFAALPGGGVGRRSRSDLHRPPGYSVGWLDVSRQDAPGL